MADDRPRSALARLPKRAGGRSPQKNATFLALAGLLAAAGGLAVLMTAVLTGFAPAAIAVLVLIMAIVALLFGGHYLIWGIWLDRSLAARGESGPAQFWKQAPPPLPGAELETEESQT